MKQIFLVLVLSMSFASSSNAQNDLKISTMDFVEVLNNNHEEALYFYKNNWKKLREIAQEKDYIDSFKLLETEADEQYPFSFILITTYANKEQYENREEHFSEVMKIKGGLELLNENRPDEFRKTLFSKEKVFEIQ
ncbi:hypothetical protein C8P64_0598 [Christiangramia gaetbulicola]|uniref:NIPSNAP protein n=1 Tax=Christiangramia gaetbulicola TaxID=703340 RepID=A0A2T6ALI2_9FLAO|nr:hypothetical protein [Christiangramia gaetbulicola]PTX44616.1 hypothetical protein C8P64_0598 [Christiangramia gaetbulicola]